MRKRAEGVVFGPVASRRLGRSLGIDLITTRTCSYDCVYCEVGRTTMVTCERREFVPAGQVLAEVEAVLREGPALDFLTLAGTGEPTLSRSLGTVIRSLKNKFSYPVAVLTNGSLLWQEEVREELAPADVVIPTLTSVNEETFRLIHRPHPSLRLAEILEGFITFRREFPGEMWLEVFLVPELNTTPQELEGLREEIARIRPHRVQLNSVHRPPPEPWVRAVSQEEEKGVKGVLAAAGIPVEIAGEVPPVPHTGPRERILSVLTGKEGTVEEVARATGLSPSVVQRHLLLLCREGMIQVVSGRRGEPQYTRREGNSCSA